MSTFLVAFDQGKRQSQCCKFSASDKVATFLAGFDTIRKRILRYRFHIWARAVAVQITTANVSKALSAQHRLELADFQEQPLPEPVIVEDANLQSAFTKLQEENARICDNYKTLKVRQRSALPQLSIVTVLVCNNCMQLGGI
eukprot:SAG31_NODE_35_length_31836_cov_10.841352_37_plen_142_part_00